MAQKLLLLCNGANTGAQATLAMDLQSKTVKWGFNTGLVSAITEQYITMEFDGSQFIAKWGGSISRVTGSLFFVIENIGGASSVFTYNCAPVKKLF
jgi:hypothetical protein